MTVANIKVVLQITIILHSAAKLTYLIITYLARVTSGGLGRGE